MKGFLKYALPAVAAILVAGCKPVKNDKEAKAVLTEDEIKARIDALATVQLTTDMSQLTENEKKMIPLLVQVADIMDELFWVEAIGDKHAFLDTIKNPVIRRFAELNYGPWDRLNDDVSFMPAFGEKPKGANFYPKDMTAEEFAKWTSPNKDAKGDTAKKRIYRHSMVRRDDAGKLKTVPYHEFFEAQIKKAAELLDSAATYADDAGLKKYLTLRAEALRTDNYNPSDIAWLQMKTNNIDFVVGPIEDYEDKLNSYRNAHEAFILVKDKEWSKKLDKYVALLPELQQGLPVGAEYKPAINGTSSDLGAYDVLYYAGHANTGGKTIAINLPNNEDIQKDYGTRRLQLKNVMHAKFDKIMLPIADELVDPSQRSMITFDAFFNTVMFHEVAHGLGIKYLVKQPKVAVKDALKDYSAGMEEGKADILGLYMITKLYEKGEFTEQQLKDCYVTFMAGIFRSVRFGTADSHGKANMVRFNYFLEKGAFSRTAEGKYKVDFAKMKDAMTSLSALLLTLQGNGDYAGTKKLTDTKGVIGEQLQKDIDRLKAKNIPQDIIFDQGLKTMGL